MMEHDIVEAHSSLDEEYTDLAEVVRGASSSLNDLQLTQQKLGKLLFCLITHAKEITAAILKESTAGYEYDDDYRKQQLLGEAYRNMDLAAKYITLLRLHDMDAEDRSQILGYCRINLYIFMHHIGVRFLDTGTCLDVGNLKSWRAEQALATVINALDIIQDYLHNTTPTSTQKLYAGLLRDELAEKTTEILQVINRSANRLEPQGISIAQSKAAIFRVVASINLLNRLVVQQECTHIEPYETYVALNLIGKKLRILEGQIETILKECTDYKNTLLGRIGYAALSYYEIVTDEALRSHHTLILPHNRSSSLSFSLVKSMSLALETWILSSTGEHSINDGNKNTASKRTPQKICDNTHAAIISYSRQLQLQERLSDAGYADYSTCLDYIESALQGVQTLIAQSGSNSNSAIAKHLEMLEESLTKSEKLCASILRNKTMDAKYSYPSRLLDSDVVVLACFCGLDKETSWATIDEEIWLQGGGGI